AISAPRHGGEEGHFITVQQRLVEAAQFLIARTHQVLLGQHLPGATTRLKYLTQLAQTAQLAGPGQLLTVQAKGFPVTGEILDTDHRGPPAMKCQLSPPCFSSRRTASMV